MEEILQRVFAIIISAIIFFLLPMYMAFEKKDDISYALALKITESFVNNVTSKGYLTRDMYDNYISELSVTGNDYTVTIEHVAKKYYPEVYSFESEDANAKVTKEFDYAYFLNLLHGASINRNDLSGARINDGTGYYSNFKLGYKMQEEKYYTDQILDTIENDEIMNKTTYSSKSISNIPLKSQLYRGNIYAMTEGDQFNVTLKNNNMSNINYSIFSSNGSYKPYATARTKANIKIDGGTYSSHGRYTEKTFSAHYANERDKFE